MSAPRQFAGGALAAIVVSGVGWALAQVTTPDPPRARPAVVRCAEDDPCWDCHTMGNRRCGPDTRSVYVHPTGRVERR